MALDKYPLLNSNERLELQEKTNFEWKLFIQKKQTDKNIRYLLMKNGFWEQIKDFTFGYADWENPPLNNKHPKFYLILMSNDKGIHFSGEWNKTMKVDIMDADINIDSAEMIILQEFFDEFGVYEYIMNLDGHNWNDK